MRAEEFISEERGGYLYHGMNEAKARAVLSNDSMPANWEKWHNNPMDPKAAADFREYEKQPEVMKRQKEWADKVAAMKAAGTYE